MPELTWSPEKPTVPGWYWWKSAVSGKSMCLPVVEGGGVLLAGLHNFHNVEVMGGEWAGPIPEPVESANLVSPADSRPRCEKCRELLPKNVSSCVHCGHVPTVPL